MAHEIIYRIDLGEPDAFLERNKLAKMDDMALFIWDVQCNLVFNRDDSMSTSDDVFKKLLEMLQERGLNAEDLTR